MKKVVLLAVIAMMAMCSQAAKFRWSASGITNPNGEGLYNGTATLMVLIDGVATVAEANYAMTGGAIASHVVTVDGLTTNSNYDFYYVMTASDGSTFTSGTKPGKAQASATATLAFQSTGTWETQGVPEPTSGLLMILGIAGLALRRKRL